MPIDFSTIQGDTDVKSAPTTNVIRSCVKCGREAVDDYYGKWYCKECLKVKKAKKRSVSRKPNEVVSELKSQIEILNSQQAKLMENIADLRTNKYILEPKFFSHVIDGLATALSAYKKESYPAIVRKKETWETVIKELELK